MLRKIFFRTAAVGLGLSFSLLLGEVIVRYKRPQVIGTSLSALDEHLRKVLKPGVKGYKMHPNGYRYTFTHNLQGLRAFKEYLQGRVSWYRILMLGDSFTYGFSVSDNETFPFFLQDICQRQDLSCEVINAGVGGTGTDYALYFFQKLGWKFFPDIAILCFYYNDFFDNSQGAYYIIGRDEKLYEQPLVKTSSLISSIFYKIQNTGWYDFLMKHSHLFCLLKNELSGYLSKSKNKLPGNPERKITPQLIRLTQIYIRALRDHVMRNGSDFLVFYLPDYSEVENFLRQGEVSEYETALRQICESEEIEFFSFNPIFAQLGEKFKSIYLGGDIHFSPYGNALVARHIFDYLKGRISKSKN